VTQGRGGSPSSPSAAIIAGAIALVAVVGLIAGAVWGQIGRGSSSTSPDAAGSTSTSPTGSPTEASESPTPSGSTETPSDTTSPAVSPTGTAPTAPATTTTSADGWRLGSWQITNTGTLGVDTTARNTATGARSATLVLYVYVSGQLIATTTASVTEVPAGGTVPVHFAGTDPWKPGQKVLLLQTA
jgi:cytoskeletal protein RodZ